MTVWKPCSIKALPFLNSFNLVVMMSAAREKIFFYSKMTSCRRAISAFRSSLSSWWSIPCCSLFNSDGGLVMSARGARRSGDGDLPAPDDIWLINELTIGDFAGDSYISLNSSFYSTWAVCCGFSRNLLIAGSNFFVFVFSKLLVW